MEDKEKSIENYKKENAEKVREFKINVMEKCKNKRDASFKH